MNISRVVDRVFSYQDNPRFREVSRSFQSSYDSGVRAIEISEQRLKLAVSSGDATVTKYLYDKGIYIDFYTNQDFIKTILSTGDTFSITLLAHTIRLVDVEQGERSFIMCMRKYMRCDLEFPEGKFTVRNMGMIFDNIHKSLSIDSKSSCRICKNILDYMDIEYLLLWKYIIDRSNPRAYSIFAHHLVSEIEYPSDESKEQTDILISKVFPNIVESIDTNSLNTMHQDMTQFVIDNYEKISHQINTERSEILIDEKYRVIEEFKKLISLKEYGIDFRYRSRHPVISR
jgi:hypothetical protein